LALLLLVATPPARAQEAPRDRPAVGAIRWDAWTHWAGETEWAGYEKCLWPRQWHYRIPFYGKITGEDQAEVRADTQEVMDQEIAYAAAGGLSYWAFGWYHPRGWTNADNMTKSLDLYLKSERRSEVNYCLILMGGLHLGPKGEWPQTADYLAARFAEPNYQKVLKGRPLVYIFDMPNLLAYWGGEAEAKAGLAELRMASVAAGAGDPYVALMIWNPATDARLVEALGADALSAYVNPPGNDNREEPYSYAVALNRWFWNEAAKAGVPLIPTVTSGWDYRPMKLPEFPDRSLESSWIAPATPKELAAHVAGCLAWMREHPETCPAGAALVYAWNEFSEGGWICPTLQEGAARLDALRPVLRPEEER
jgi:hypothetical protein